ncbi:FliH/SctL family protein [Endozoicomonas sp. 8E]|uniref:FliH/SctL family protein n=1 Tax=Endozoicomonas sp. 8E TaxID=3035692 RepID=UPI002939492B|nr:FliH/SctL family protein [Endozoicomonas sp. 8E]WOG29084.1 FliH/SctL family protein [Endozoicomonas sp. 8E]
MTNRQKIWQPETAAFKRFLFPVHRKPGEVQSSEIDQQTADHSAFQPEETVQNKVPATRESIEPSAEVLQSILEQGIEKGYAKGVEEGRRMGFEEGRELGVREGGRIATEEQKKLVSLLRKEMSEFRSGGNYGGDEKISWLGKVIEETCRQVVRRELMTSPEQIVSVVRETLSIMPEDAQYTIHVNPVNAELLKKLKPDFGAAWQVVEDHELQMNDCRIISSQTEAEARMESRLVECLDIIRENLPAAMEDAG